MSVQFDENNIPRGAGYGSEQVPKIASFLIQKGIAKDIAGANRMLFISVGIVLAISVYIGISSTGGAKDLKVPADVVLKSLETPIPESPQE
jgi:hypothetical protein